MPKYKPGDRFIVEITGVDNEASFRGYPHPTYLVKGMNGAFSENVLDKLERIEPQMAAGLQNNADRIRAMSDEKLAEFLASIQCPDEDMIVICNKEFFAEVEILKWLQSGVEDKKSPMAAAPRTNQERMQSMSIEELAAAIWCPYVKEGYLPCMDEDLDSQGCLECRREWLQKEEDTNGKNNP